MPRAAGQTFRCGVLLMALALFGSCGGRAAFKQAEEALKRGRFQQAIELLRTYYLDNPTADASAEALLRIGNIYRLHLKDFKKAAEAYEVLVNRYSSRQEAREARLVLADLQMQQFQDYEQAIVEYQNIAADNAFSVEQRARAKFETGNAYYALSNFQQARIEYLGIKEIVGDNGDGLIQHKALLQLAHTFDAEEDYENAIAYYKQVAELPHDDKSAKELSELKLQGKFGWASCLEALGQYEEALKGYNEVIDSYPSRRVVEIRIERMVERMREVKK